MTAPKSIQTPINVLFDAVDHFSNQLAESENSSTADKIKGLVTFIVMKCNNCKADSNGKTQIHEVAECSADCALNLVGPTVYLKILEMLELRDNPAGGLQ